jgi:hypothetical protein
MRFALVLVMSAAVLSGCSGGGGDDEDPFEDVAATFAVTSSAFTQGQPIPVRYTCDGADVSPPLAFRDLPDDTRTLALILDDPDAPDCTWNHWTFWNLPSTVPNLPEGADLAALGGREGKTSYGEPGYSGPCPPPETHRYFFKAYALDANLDLAAGASKAELRGALEGHVIATGELMGTYASPG